jgi:tyrosinase
MATGAPSAKHPATPIRYRPSVTQMSADQVKRLRAAFTAVQKLTDDRGYQYFAGLHGLPLPAWCDRYGHGKPTFLHWHRAYLLRFEQALQRAANDPSVMLPWWDWRSTRAIPDIYAKKTANGKPNPLYSVRINNFALQQGLQGKGGSAAEHYAHIPNTVRVPGLPGTVLPTAAQITTILDYDFPSFTDTLEGYHGEVHVWVGGHMSEIPFAAFDPIFFAHHAMVDRVWSLWQVRHHGAPTLPAALEQQVMQPFHLTAVKTVDTAALGYDYALSSVHVPVP